MKLTLMIDTKELSREELESHGLILKNLLPYLNSEFNLVLITDKISKEHEILNMQNICSFEKKCCSTLDVIKYHYWISKAISRYKPDIFFQINHFLPFKDKRNRTIKIIEIHDLFPLERIGEKNIYEKRKFYLGLKASINNTDAIVVPSKFTLERLNYFFKVNKEQFIIPSPYMPLKTSIEKSVLINNIKYILYLGRICYWKGTDLLIKLFTLYPIPKVKLVLAGKLENQMRKILEQSLHESNNIIYLGYIKDEEKAYLMKNAELFVYPTRYDGYGICPIEAIMHGLPIVVSNIPVMKEKFGNENVYFDLKQGIFSLREAIERMLFMDKKNRERMLAMLRERFSNNNIENYAIGLIKIIKRLLRP